MMKTIEVIGEVIRNPKHPFRKAEHHSKKYLGDWLSEEMEMA
jgi:hypothetical protein